LFILKGLLAGLFYVQDVLYAAAAWMQKSGDVQDVLYAAAAWMQKSGDVQTALCREGHDCKDAGGTITWK